MDSACEYNLILPLSALGAPGVTAPSILNTSRTTTSPVPLVSKNKLAFELFGRTVVSSICKPLNV